MDGVTILNTYQGYSFADAVLLTIEIVFAVISLAISVTMLDENLLISCVFGALATMFIIGCFCTPKTITYYEVIVDDNVSFNDFMSRYKIETVKGKIIKVSDVVTDKE